MKWISILGLVVLAVLAGLILNALRLPDEFRIERTTRIQARPEKIFPLVNDLEAFNTWNPFAKADPAAVLRYGTPVAGEGAAFEWDSTGQSGAGRIEIIRSMPSESVAMSLEFRRPFAARNAAEFTLAPAGDATDVSWTMTGRSSFLQRLMSVFFDMDELVGGEFAKGLADLKVIAER
jgi:hypothetical protein